VGLGYIVERGDLMLRTIVIIFAIITILTEAYGQQVLVVGVGNGSCGKWIEDRRSAGPSMFITQGWIAGYLTAYNNYAPYANGNVSRGTDVDGLFAWIDRYCRANPLDSIFRASSALILDLEKRQ